MPKRLFCSDIEADDLLDGITQVWCATFQEFDTSMKIKGDDFTFQGFEGYGDMMEMFTNPDNILVMHNGVGYDKRAMEKVMKIKVEAVIIDTLYLSWYLYPKMKRHGLAVWGELLGIAKPEIDNWDTLSIEEYVHRCREDVRIQSALWVQMWNHLNLLYDTSAEIWHLCHYLSFKAECAAIQMENPIKLNVKKAETLQAEFDSKRVEALENLVTILPDVPVYKVCNRPKKPFKMDGKLSVTGKKWEALVDEYVSDEDFLQEEVDELVDYPNSIKFIASYKPPNAGSSAQIKKFLFSLGWIPETFEYKRDNETNKVRSIPQIKNDSELCSSIVRLTKDYPQLLYLEKLSIYQHRLSVVSGFLNNITEDGRLYGAIQGLTNTLRFKHKILANITSARKPFGKELRGLLIASKGNELCGSDQSSLENRTQMHFMMPYDPKYVMTMCKPDFDSHLDMALSASMLDETQIEFYKNFDIDNCTEEEHEMYLAIGLIRYAGKQTNYAATYGAQGLTVSRSAGVTEEVGHQLVDAYWKRNWSLKAIADDCLVKNSRGMSWLYNPVAKIWMHLKSDKDRFSTLNQSTGTYAFDRWVCYILEQRNQLSAQFHDEVILEIPLGTREETKQILNNAQDKVNAELRLGRDLDCSIDFGNSYADIH